MTIDVVGKLELLVELFELRAPPAAEVSSQQGKEKSAFVPPKPAARLLTSTLSEMLGDAQFLIEAYERSLRGQDQNLESAVHRVARFLVENAETIAQDNPQPPRLLHYVYPII